MKSEVAVFGGVSPAANFEEFAAGHGFFQKQPKLTLSY